MNEEIIIRALIQKANEFDDEYLQNPSLVKMLVKKEIEFNNYDKIVDFLDFLKNTKELAQKSR